MKISEMTTDQATNAMIRIAGPISNICDDEDALKILDEIQNAAVNDPDMHPVKQIAKFLPKIVMFGLSKHKMDFYEIIGALNEMPASKVGKMNIVETINVVKDSYDDVLKSFFTRSATAEKSSGKESA